MLISSALVWAAVLGAEGGFDVNWLGTNTTETRFGLPLTVSAGNGSYWCIKSRQADPDLIILGHLKIYSPTPGSNTCPMSPLHATKTCPRVCPPLLCTPSLTFYSFNLYLLFHLLLVFFAINSTYPIPKTPVHKFTFPLAPFVQKPFRFLVWGERLEEAGGAFMTFPCLPNLKNPN